MSSRQSKRKRPSTEYQEDSEYYASKKSAKRAKKAAESVSSIGSVSLDSSDENSDWLQYDQSANRPTRVRKKSAKLLEAEEEVELFPVEQHPGLVKSSGKRDKNGKRATGKDEDLLSGYSAGHVPELKISIGKDREEKGSSRKSKDKRKKSGEGMPAAAPMYAPAEIIPESKHKSWSKKSKRNIPAPLESYPPSPVKDKDSGIKLKLILSPKEKEKSEAFYSISSPEAEFAPASALEKEKKKKRRKDKETIKTKLTFHSDGSQQSSLSEIESSLPESKKSKKKKRKQGEADEGMDFPPDITTETGEKPAKKKKKKAHAEVGQGKSEIPIFDEPPPLIIEEKSHKEKKKKQKKDKREKDKKDKKEKPKDKNKDKMKIKLKVPGEQQQEVAGFDREVSKALAAEMNHGGNSLDARLSESIPKAAPAAAVPEKQKKSSKPKEKKEKKESKSKGTKKERGKKDKKEKSKKPLSAYMLWCNHYRSKLVADHPGIDFSTISKKLGAIWQQLSVKEKAKWKRRQKVQKTKHKNVPNLSRNKHELKDKGPKQKPGSPVRKASSPIRSHETNTQPIDMAAYLKLLGESLSLVGNRLQEHQGSIEVHGSLSVLLDSTLCALGPLLCLTSQVKELDGCPHSTQVSLLDNVAYIMPGL